MECMDSEWDDVFSKVVVLALLGPTGLQQCYNYTYGSLFTLKCVWREFAGPYRLRGVCSEGLHGGYEQGVCEQYAQWGDCVIFVGPNRFPTMV